MTTLLVLPTAATAASVVVAVGSLLRKRSSPAAWFFAAGMVVLGIESALTSAAMAAGAESAAEWGTRALLARSFLPPLWFGFTLYYSRGDGRGVLERWRVPLAVLFVVPGLALVGASTQLVQSVGTDAFEPAIAFRFSPLAKVLSACLLVSFSMVLMNLEQTFRAAVGTMRWRIKFAVVAFGLIFGSRIYAESEVLLFSGRAFTTSAIESASLLIGCILLGVAYARSRGAEIDVYPSSAVLRSSFTVLVVGGYLFVVGVAAQVVRLFGGAEVFQFQALIVVAGMAAGALLLLSDRTRRGIQAFGVRHFKKSQHDSVRVWTRFSNRLAQVHDVATLGSTTARLVSETFETLSVTFWVHDIASDRLSIVASTAGQGRDARTGATSKAVATALTTLERPCDLTLVNEPWAEEFLQLNPASFASGGSPWCVSLRTVDSVLGALVLVDRVGGVSYTAEEQDLLACIGAQVTSVMLSLRLVDEVARAREMEAFRTMSAFFVHDLKNAASSLNLMLRNLPVHFEDPAFREDALRGIGNTTRRIEELIERLTVIRQRPELALVEANLNQVVSEAIDGLARVPNVEVRTELHPIPAIRGDREMLRSVVTNLVVNAREAVRSGGCVEVRTERQSGRVVLIVADDGCGMSPAFVRESLFQPFQSTKKGGVGIGLFQSRSIVHAHGGQVDVASEPGKGTTFRVSFPVRSAE